MATSTTRADVERAASGPWVERLGRAGLAAKGLLYGLVGILALQIAFGDTGQQADQQGAIAAAANAPFGRWVLMALAVGFAGYALWRGAQAFLDSGDHDGVMAVVMRTSYVVRALIYAALAALTVRQLVAGGSSSGGQTEQSVTKRILELPAGAWLVAGVGAVLIGVALYQAYRGFSGDFDEDFRAGSMSRRERRWVRRIGAAGHTARAIVFGLVGAFVIQAALDGRTSESVGLDGALGELADRAWGPWLLAAVAVGLFLYGLYCLAEARFGRIRLLS